MIIKTLQNGQTFMKHDPNMLHPIHNIPQYEVILLLDNEYFTAANTILQRCKAKWNRGVLLMVCEMIIFGIYYKPTCRVFFFIIYLTARVGSLNTFNILIYVILYIVLCIHNICPYI